MSKRYILVSIFAIFLLSIDTIVYAGNANLDNADCTITKHEKVFPLYGKVKLVDYNEDIRVEIVEYNADVSVKIVEYSSQAQECGCVKIVDYNEDIKVKIVQYNGDVTVKLVKYNPGIR